MIQKTLKSILIFILAGLCEIGGGYLVELMLSFVKSRFAGPPNGNLRIFIFS